MPAEFCHQNMRRPGSVRNTTIDLTGWNCNSGYLRGSASQQLERANVPLSPPWWCGWGTMQIDPALGLMNELLWTCMLVAGPVLAAALLTGLLISVLQVATQLQEMTLSYIPKMFVSAVVLILLGPWMIHRLVQFAFRVIAIIPSLG